jgi:hypothetical protein
VDGGFQGVVVDREGRKGSAADGEGRGEEGYMGDRNARKRRYGPRKGRI